MTSLVGAVALGAASMSGTAFAKPHEVEGYVAKNALAEVLLELPVGIQECDGDSYRIRNFNVNDDKRVTVTTFSGRANDHYIVQARYTNETLTDLTLDSFRGNSDSDAMDLFAAAKISLFKLCLDKRAK